MRPQEMHPKTELQKVEMTQELDAIVEEKFTNFKILQARLETNEVFDRSHFAEVKTFDYSKKRSLIQLDIDRELIEHLKKLCKDNLELRTEILQIKTNVARMSGMQLAAKGMRNPYAVEEMD